MMLTPTIRWLDPVEFDSGHKLIDNTHGDYSLHCPTHGEVGFAHLGIVGACLAGKQVCWACQLPVGAPKP